MESKKSSSRAVARRGNKPLKIGDLPSELLQHIFLWAKIGPSEPNIEDFRCYGSRRREDPNSVAPNEEYPLFKSLRLVCRAWHALATPMLFQEVVLMPNVESWAHLNSVALSPSLAGHVKTIQLATIGILPRLTGFKEWKNYNADHLTYGGSIKLSRPNRGPLSKLDTSPQSYFQRFQQWRDREQAMDDHWRQHSAPALRLDLLCNLSRVETIGHADLAVIKKEYNQMTNVDWVSDWWTHIPGTRREVETLVQDDTRYGGDIRTFHLELFLTAVQSCGISAHTLAIRNTQEFLLSKRPLSFRAIRRLEICTDYDWWRPYRERERFPLSKWFHTLENLEELHINQISCCGDDKDIFAILADVHWPCLKKVTAPRASTVCDSLVAFLDRHRKSIEYLDVDGSDWAKDEWRRFCEEETVEGWRDEGKELVLRKKGDLLRGMWH